MLKDIHYSGYELIEASYSLLDKVDGPGSFHANFELADGFQFLNTYDEHDAPLKNILEFSVLAVATGVNQESEKPVFETKVKVKLSFEMSPEIKLEEKFVEENEWYFINFSHMALKEVSDDLMRRTSFQGVKLPSCRVDKN